MPALPSYRNQSIDLQAAVRKLALCIQYRRCGIVFLVPIVPKILCMCVCVCVCVCVWVGGWGGVSVCVRARISIQRESFICLKRLEMSENR